MKETIHLEIELDQKMCEICKRRSEEYFELKVQLRFKDLKHYDENLNLIDDKKFKENYKKKLELFYKKFYDKINKVEELNEFDIDFFVLDKNLIDKIKRYFENDYFLEFKESKKTVGRNFQKSKDIYKYTLLIKIYNIKKNDILNYKKDFYIVKNIDNTKITFKNIKTNKIVSDFFKNIKDFLE